MPKINRVKQQMDFINEAIWADISAHCMYDEYVDEDDTYENTIEVMDTWVVNFEFKPNKDELEICSIETYDLEKLFEEHNIKYIRSYSESIYFRFKNKDYRVSKHYNGNYYENNIVCDSIEEMYNKVVELIC